MAHLIDKDALVAEIERRINEINLDSIEDWRYRIQRELDIEVMKNILSLLDTLEVKEVKEVDLEKEMDAYWDKYCNDEFGELVERSNESFDNIAKHFFELGLKATQKGE